MYNKVIEKNLGWIGNLKILRSRKSVNNSCENEVECKMSYYLGKCIKIYIVEHL